jgi:tRNA wybutosine-synthesizing protein 2
VLLGYFPNTERYLSAAFRFLKHHGVLHYHNIYKRSELWTKPLNEVQRAAKHAGYKILSVAQRVVKSYAPGILHIVLDIEVEKLR